MKAVETIAGAATKQGVDRLVHVSALGAEGRSPSKVFQLKAQGERVLTDLFPEATIVRPAECYGHEDDYFNRYACKSCHLLGPAPPKTSSRQHELDDLL